MFWILRRTGAASFFNSINNNNSSKPNSNNNNNSVKNNQRPPRKAYGRLSVESDDTTISVKNKEFISSTELDNHHTCHLNKTNNRTDLHGNIEDSDSDLEINNKLKQATRNRRIDENTISRLQAMAMSDDDDDYDESLTCNVCDRAFHCHRQLASHQQKKRHFGCSGCDSLFPSLMLLEHHKEEFEHWSDGEDETRRMPCCRRNRIDDEFTDTDTITSDAESEDMERLL